MSDTVTSQQKTGYSLTKTVLTVKGILNNDEHSLSRFSEKYLDVPLLVNVGLVELVEHPVKSCDLSRLIGNDREVYGRLAGSGKVVDVLDPTSVRLGVVGRQTDELTRRVSSIQS